jgi:hypothetical protein
VILVIMSVSTFMTAVILYMYLSNLYPELSVLTLSPISVNAYMPRILAKSVY